jgi:hypothetical protein
MEVGANKGGLYTMLKEKRNIHYNVLDMYKNNELDESIDFVQGNCEEFNFTGYNTLILSHVFEHLYSPLTFIKNIKKNSVSTVFISIPNFDFLLKEESISIIHSQHTFFCGLDYILYMFSLHKYKCENYITYQGNFKSYMLKFVLDESIVPLFMPSTDVRLYKNIYENKIDYYKNIEVPPNSYIFPSGIYGQYLYYFLINKKNIVGFLDNNNERHNKKLYGTDKLTFSPLHVDLNHSTIIICDCPYKNEIISGLKVISPSIRFLCI